MIGTLTRPQMPYGDYQADERAKKQRQRQSMLDEEHDVLVAQFMKDRVGEELAGVWQADLGVNTLLAGAESNSALYNDIPTVSHPDPAGAPVCSPSGPLAEYWPSQQRTQLYALGLGDWIRVPGIANGRLLIRHVSPADAWVRCSASNPREPEELWELIQTPLKGEDGKMVMSYAWEVWLLKADAMTLPGLGKGPTRRILDPDLKDCTEEIHGRTFDEAAYPCWRDGKPYIPHVFFSPIVDDRILHPSWMRGAYLGALGCILGWSAVQKSLIAAAGPMVVTWGLNLPSTIQRAGQPDRNRSLIVTPGCIVQATVAEGLPSGIQPTIKTLDSANSAEVLVKTAVDLEAKQTQRWGAGEGSAQRSGASPWSGAALTVSNFDKRLNQRKYAPAFRLSDGRLIANVVNIMVAAGLLPMSTPETGYSISYQEIPLTPEELTQLREHLDWQVERGYMTRAEAYCELHPGTDVEAANARLKMVAITEATLDEEIKTTKKDLGFEDDPEPKAEPEPAPDPMDDPEDESGDREGDANA